MSLLFLFLFGLSYLILSTNNENLIHENIPFYSVVAESILWVIFLFLFVAVWKFYCVEWKKLSHSSVLQAIFDKLWFPFVTVFLVTNSSYYNSSIPKYSVVISGVALFIALIDVDSSIKKAVENIFCNVNINNQRMLYSHYPPLSRADLLPMDLLINIGVVIMIIKKIY